jgi:hypothetical protein
MSLSGKGRPRAARGVTRTAGGEKVCVEASSSFCPRAAVALASDAAARCGKERRPVKTATDADIGLVNRNAVIRSSIRELIALDEPVERPQTQRVQLDAQSDRLRPYLWRRSHQATDRLRDCSDRSGTDLSMHRGSLREAPHRGCGWRRGPRRSFFASISAINLVQATVRPPRPAV